jgi:hypothetical protein
MKRAMDIARLVLSRRSRFETLRDVEFRTDLISSHQATARLSLFLLSKRNIKYTIC